MHRQPYRPRPARLELRLNQAPTFVLRLEQEQARQLLNSLRLLRAGASLVAGREQAHDEDVCDCLCALIEHEFGALRQEER